MTRKTKLEALLAKVEAGTCSNDGIMYRSFGDDWTHCFDAYNGSLDAAKALHEAVLPEWEYGYDGSIAWVKLPGLRTSYRHDAMGGYTSRAWLIAIIKALISMEPEAKGDDA